MLKIGQILKGRFEKEFTAEIVKIFTNPAEPNKLYIKARFYKGNKLLNEISVSKQSIIDRFKEVE